MKQAKPSIFEAYGRRLLERESIPVDQEKEYKKLFTDGIGTIPQEKPEGMFTDGIGNI